MNKSSLMTGILGLIVGLVVGFMFANSVNKTTYGSTAAQTSAPPGAANPALPADHPPLGPAAGGDGQPGSGGAIPQVTEAIEKAKSQPNDFEAQMTAADLYYQIQRFDDAAKFYEAALTIKPEDQEALIKTGNAYFDAEKYVEAEKFYTAALKKEPKNINVRTDLGLTFFLREPRDLDNAIREYNASLAIEPDHEITLQNLVLALRESGQTDALNSATEKLTRVNPNNPALTSAQKPL